MPDIASPKIFLDVLNPSVTPRATRQEKLDAIRAIEKMPWDGETLDALLTLNAMLILRPYLRGDDSEMVLVTADLVAECIATDMHMEKHCQAVIEHGMHEEFISLVDHPSADVVRKATWVLGTICVNSTSFQNTLLSCGIADKMCAAFERNQAGSTLRDIIALWIPHLCRSRSSEGYPRPDEMYLRPIYETMRRTLVSLDRDGLGSAREGQWFNYVLHVVSSLMDSDESGIQQCLAYGLPQLVLKLTMASERALVEEPEVSPTETVRRRVASEQLGEVLSYLPGDHLVRLCAASKDVSHWSVCDHRDVYELLRLNYILAEHSLRREVIQIIRHVLIGNDSQATVIFAHSVAVLESMAVLPDLKTVEKPQLLRAIMYPAARSEYRARVIFSSDVLQDLIGSAFLDFNKEVTIDPEQEFVSEASLMLSKVRFAETATFLFTNSKFVAKVLIPAIAMCLFHSTSRSGALFHCLYEAYELFDIELPPSRVAAIERCIELSGLSQRKQQEQLSIVDALWDRDTRARRCEASVEDIAGRLRRYWDLLQGCWSAARHQGVGGEDGDDWRSEYMYDTYFLGFEETVFLLYQEVSEEIVLRRKRGREE